MQFLTPERHPNVEAVRRAWHEYVSNDVVPPESIRPYVKRAWQRSRALGCDAQLARADVLSPSATGTLLTERVSLVRSLDPFLAALSRAAGNERHAAMLADEHGRLLQLAGDEATMADENFPHPGALLSESTSGANGVGTALAEDGYVELVGPEHYIEGFHQFTCQGVPLHGPDSSVIAILSMSVRRLATADRVRDILFCASEAAECELLAQWLTGTVNGGRTDVLERLRQDIVQKLTIARLRLEQAVQHVSARESATRSIEAALQLSRKFNRQAAVWRSLAVDEQGMLEPERIELADLAEDFLDLMQTEARVASVHLAWGAADRCTVLDSRAAFSRRLLTIFLSAIQEAGPGATIEISVGGSQGFGWVGVTGMPALPANSVRHVAAAPLIS